MANKALKILRAHVQAEADAVLAAALIWDLEDLERTIVAYRKARALLDQAEGRSHAS